MNPPDSVTLETLAALSRAQVLFDNIGVGRGGVSEFLRSFAGESRALRFDGLAEKERVRRSEEAIFSELRLGRSAAFVTRGNALVMGAFAVAFIMRCRREGIPYEVHGALSTVDLLTAFAIERLGETAPEYAMFTSDGFLAAAPAKMRGPLALFPYGRLGRAEVKTVERSLLRARPRQQPCLVFGPHEESPPERVALTAFARRYPQIHVSLAMYLPGRGWDGRGFPGPNGDPQLLLAGLGVFPERTATWETVFELSRCGIVFSRAGASAERALQSLLPELRVERFRGADGVLRALERGQRVALLCPGGPALWDEAARGLLESARARGRAVRVLAAVSPLDCLVAHLEESFGESFAGAKVVSAQWLRKDSIDPEIPLVVCWEGVGAPAGPMARAYPAGSKCLVLDAGRGEVLERVLDGLPWSELEPGSAVWVPPRRGLPSRTAE